MLVHQTFCNADPRTQYTLMGKGGKCIEMIHAGKRWKKGMTNHGNTNRPMTTAIALKQKTKSHASMTTIDKSIMKS